MCTLLSASLDCSRTRNVSAELERFGMVFWSRYVSILASVSEAHSQGRGGRTFSDDVRDCIVLRVCMRGLGFLF